MLKKYPIAFSLISVELFDIESSLVLLEESEKIEDLEIDEKRALKSVVEKAQQIVSELGMDAAEMTGARILENVSRFYAKETAHNEVKDYRRRINDQLSSKWFMYIPQNMLKYYGKPLLFGQAVNDRFPRAIDDIESAGSCLALGQGTATVMHLMRVLEEGLKVLALGLKIPYAPSWESYLAQIQTKIAEKHKNKSARWKKVQPLYRDLSGDLMTIKQAWRNPTMHIDRRYSVDEAEQIFKAAKTFMERLTTLPV